MLRCDDEMARCDANDKRIPFDRLSLRHFSFHGTGYDRSITTEEVVLYKKILGKGGAGRKE